ncbi:alpha/beta hydrolase [Arcicella rosea]|uniref:Homoserine O-acetyltransferase n=1 Tax=Arcicella rosea TaxID=502909 RepID=A0A841ELK3_9BACT|nr:alpha/beta hydrolase [Arcicella rosea]MBB6004075.1 homoserine O-acetyltransferase [Arcicella rosea]
MKKLFIITLLLLVQSAYAQQRYYQIGDFQLENGQVLKDCKIGYRTFGKLNAGKSNAVLVPTWFTGTSQQKSFIANPSDIADSTKYFVIIVDALGNGVSSSPSNSVSQKDKLFPVVSIRDMVATQYKLVKEVLKINHLYAVTGISMGGMQSFQWMMSYPDFMDKVIPIIGSPKQSTYDKLYWNLQLNSIERGQYSAEAMKTINALHQLNLWTPSYREAHTNTEEYASYIKKIEDDALKLNAYDWATQLRAMINHDIFQGQKPEEAFAKVKAKVMIVVATQDHMVNPQAAIRFGKLLKAPIVELTGDCGHMATSCEGDKMRAHIKGFLD